MMAAGTTIMEFIRNLSRMTHSCVFVDAIVVSDINDRLSPKKEPPTTTATMKGSAISVFSASPTATEVRATIVPTLVPIDREIKQAAINIPASSRLSGRICNVRLTVASIAPICLALCAKAPARINIHIISRIFLLAAPTENW